MVNNVLERITNDVVTHKWATLSAAIAKVTHITVYVVLSLYTKKEVALIFNIHVQTTAVARSSKDTLDNDTLQLSRQK